MKSEDNNSMHISRRVTTIIFLALLSLTGAVIVAGTGYLGTFLPFSNVVCAAPLKLAGYGGCGGYGEGGYYAQGFYFSGHTIASGSFTTPNCLPPLSASCSVSPSSANIGQTVTWTAFPSGGTGSYSYSWSGTDGLSGSTQSVQKSYSSQGVKSGSVTVTSGSQQVTQACVNSVTVAAPQCRDDADNDGDGKIDFDGPGTTDPGCSSLDDNDEFNLPECSDGVDNADPEDTIADFPADPGCDNAADDDETNAPLPEWKEVPPAG